MKENLGVMVKLLLCDLVVTGSNRGNNFLQCRIRLCIIDLMWSNPSQGPALAEVSCTRLPLSLYIYNILS